jgi:hypothetical protein
MQMSRARLRALAWIALGLIAVGYVWDCAYIVRFTSARLFPFELMTWSFVWAPFLLKPLPLLGYWLLCDALWMGGGRWGWRWVCGGLLVGLLLRDVAFTLQFYGSLHGRPYFPLETDRPYLLRALQLIAAGPVAMLRWRERSAAI